MFYNNELNVIIYKNKTHINLLMTQFDFIAFLLYTSRYEKKMVT